MGWEVDAAEVEVNRAVRRVVEGFAEVVKVA